MAKNLFLLLACAAKSALVGCCRFGVHGTALLAMSATLCSAPSFLQGCQFMALTQLKALILLVTSFLSDNTHLQCSMHTYKHTEHRYWAHIRPVSMDNSAWPHLPVIWLNTYMPYACCAADAMLHCGVNNSSSRGAPLQLTGLLADLL